MAAGICIDPGTEKSGYVIWDGTQLFEKGFIDNLSLLMKLQRIDREVDSFVIEEVRSYGMRVGLEVFKTVEWSGRFYEAFISSRNFHGSDGLLYPELYSRYPAIKIHRKAIALHHCGKSTANDGAIRAAIHERFGSPGVKANPNPLTYGVTSHIMAAFALAVSWTDGLHILIEAEDETRRIAKEAAKELARRAKKATEAGVKG